MLQLLMASYVSFVQNTKSFLSMNDIEICLTFFFLSDSYIVCYAMTLSLTIFAGSCPCADGRDFRAVL